MKVKIENIAADISRNEELVEFLDNVLTECSDRAYVVCSATECVNNTEGSCTIHLVKGKRTLLGNGRCADYAM